MAQKCNRVSVLLHAPVCIYRFVHVRARSGAGIHSPKNQVPVRDVRTDGQELATARSIHELGSGFRVWGNGRKGERDWWRPGVRKTTHTCMTFKGPRIGGKGHRQKEAE